jgi:hypothetical protein
MSKCDPRSHPANTKHNKTTKVKDKISKRKLETHHKKKNIKKN